MENDLTKIFIMDNNEKNIQNRNREQNFRENSYEVNNTLQITNKEYKCNIGKKDFDTHEKLTKHLSSFMLKTEIVA